MLLKKVKQALKSIGYNKINKSQEKLNQYGYLMQELEIDLANLHAIKEQLQIAKKVKETKDAIQKEKELQEKVEEKIEKIERAKDFEELNIKSIGTIKKLLQGEQIILSPEDINITSNNQLRRIPYIIYGFDNMSEDILSQIYTNSKRVQEFNINSINGIKNRYIIIIPVYEIPQNNILGITSENRLKVKKFDSLKNAIILCSEKDLSKVHEKDIERIGVKGENIQDYVQSVITILGENLEESSVDIREFELYKYYESKQTETRNLRKGKSIKSRYYQRKSNMEVEHTRKETIKLFSRIMERCMENSEFKSSDDMYAKLTRIYTWTVDDWRKVHNRFNYELQLDNKSYKIRPDVADNNFPIDDKNENDTIYNAAKITYTVNRLAHAYKKQIELLIKSNFYVQDDNQVREIKDDIKKAYNNKERETEYKDIIRRLRGAGGKLLEANQVEKYVNIIGKRIELEKEAFKCKDSLIDYISNRMSELPMNKRKNYVYGQITDENGTALVLDIPMYEQLRVHVVSEIQKFQLQAKLPKYPLDILTMNRGNILVKGLNPELKQRLESLGSKWQMEEFIRENTSKQQAHEVFLLMGYQGEELINAVNARIEKKEIII